MIRPILQRGSPLLTQACSEVVDINSIQTIIRDLRDTTNNFKQRYNVTRGVGLAAPQIGELIQLSLVENKTGQEFVLVNPYITNHSTNKTKIREGCLSFLEVRGNTPRYSAVTVQALNEAGKPYSISSNEPNFAMLLQHEIDHLQGILYIDHLENGEEELYAP